MKTNISFAQHILRVILLLASIFLLPGRNVAQVFEFRRIAAGADSGEIYITCYWYDSYPSGPYGGLFRSTDHGQTLSVQYKDNWLFGILYCDIYGDSLLGTLFGLYGLSVSHDYGLTWELHENPTMYYLEGGGGSVSGEVYLAGYDSANIRVLYHCTNFGDSLYLMNTTLDSLFRIEAGSLPGELFALKYPYFGGSNHDTLGLAFSNDYGQSFVVNLLDTPIVQNLYQYTLTHGPDTGELYLIGRKGGAYQYHILHSMDYGHTFSLQHITPEFNNGWDEFSFVAGREPGSFYILKYYYCATVPLHTCLEIFYSSDYGVTYSVFYHELDSTYTGAPSINEPSDPISCFPNPVSDNLTVKCSIGSRESTTIQLLDLTGRIQCNATIGPNQTEVNIDTEALPAGVYFLKITRKSQVVGMKKVIVSR
jgi:hypothetical protein